MSEETRDEWARERIERLQRQNLKQLDRMDKLYDVQREQERRMIHLEDRVQKLETALRNQPANDGL